MSDVLLTAQNLGKRFGGLVAVDDLSFDLNEGEILGLIGPNGAGKSTTFNLLAGALGADTGAVKLDGANVLGLKPHQIAARGVMRTFQHNSPFSGMTLIENLLVGAHTRFPSSWVSVLFGGSAARERERELRDHAHELLDFVGLAELEGTEVDNLSFGQGRLLEVARALAGEPRLIMLDEPAAGLTLSEAERLAEIIRGISARGIAVLLIEHDMRFLLPLAHRVVVLNFGAKIAEGRPDEITSDPVVMAAYLGDSGMAHRTGSA
jgi:branched-chain amino acid transport system ATP-binding protein